MEKIKDIKSPIDTNKPSNSDNIKEISKNKREDLIMNIVKMGYSVEDVKRALRASFDNPERAIEYLIDGIPKSPTTPEGANDVETTETEISPFEFLRTNPDFRRLKRLVMQNPEFLEAAINRMSELKQQTLRFVHENPHDFLSMMLEISDSEDDETIIDGD